MHVAKSTFFFLDFLKFFNVLFNDKLLQRHFMITSQQAIVYWDKEDMLKDE